MLSSTFESLYNSHRTGKGSIQDVVLQAIEDILQQNSNDKKKAACQLYESEQAKDEVCSPKCHDENDTVESVQVEDIATIFVIIFLGEL